jgi:hypothetical protein
LPEFDQKSLNDALTKLDGDPAPIYERLPPIDQETNNFLPVLASPTPPKATEPKTKAQKANHALANGTHKAASKGDKASVKTKTKKATQKKITTAAATVKKTTAVTAKKATPKAVSSKHEGSPGGYFHGQ